MDLKGPELRAVEFKQLGHGRVPPFHLVQSVRVRFVKEFQPRLDTERTGVSSEHTFGASDSGRTQFGVFQFPSSQQHFVHFSLHVGVPIVDSTRDSLTSQRRSVQPLTDSQGMAPQQKPSQQELQRFD